MESRKVFSWLILFPSMFLSAVGMVMFGVCQTLGISMESGATERPSHKKAMKCWNIFETSSFKKTSDQIIDIEW